MPKNKRPWTDYPPAYAALAKSVATAALPAFYGPFSRDEALRFRSGFYRFREALRGSLTARDGSYPARLYEMVESLSVSIIPTSDNPNKYHATFDLDPIVREMDRIDPAAAQIRKLAKAHFAAAQQLTTRAQPISEPIFSDDELEDRLDEIKHSH